MKKLKCRWVVEMGEANGEWACPSVNGEIYMSKRIKIEKDYQFQVNTCQEFDINIIGRSAERKFLEWLIHKRVSFTYCDQSVETFPPIFRRDKIKRPDFFIFIKNLGKIAIDVKSRAFNMEFENFILDEEEVQKLAAFQKMSGIPVWLAISTPEIQHNTWYWISLNEVLENVNKKISSRSNEPFRPIGIKDCITIGWKDGLEKLIQAPGKSLYYQI